MEEFEKEILSSILGDYLSSTEIDAVLNRIDKEVINGRIRKRVLFEIEKRLNCYDFEGLESIPTFIHLQEFLKSQTR